MMRDWQTGAALAVVAVTAGVFLWRFLRQRGKGCGGNCGHGNPGKGAGKPGGQARPGKRAEMKREGRIALVFRGSAGDRIASCPGCSGEGVRWKFL